MSFLLVFCHQIFSPAAFPNPSILSLVTLSCLPCFLLSFFNWLSLGIWLTQLFYLLSIPDMHLCQISVVLVGQIRASLCQQPCLLLKNSIFYLLLHLYLSFIPLFTSLSMTLTDSSFQNAKLSHIKMIVIGVDSHLLVFDGLDDQ